jgi:hypothetical protein
MEHAHEPDAAAREPASDIDEQILVMWRALRANPSLDARWAMQVIDRLLDQRPRLVQVPPPGPPVTTSRSLDPGSPVQQAILASVVRALLTDELR